MKTIHYIKISSKASRLTLLLSILFASATALTGCIGGKMTISSPKKEEKPQKTQKPQGSQGELAAVCGDGVFNETKEKCDTTIPQGTKGACPVVTECQVKKSITVCKHYEIKGNDCQAECLEVDTTTCQDGDGCCPTGCTQANDNDCAPACNDGYWDKASEKCDTAINQGQPGACTTAAACATKTSVDACKEYEFRGSGCQAECLEVAKTVCQDNDGCCVPGCNFSQDNDCPKPPSSCNDGNWDKPGEKCDTGINQGEAGACPIAAACSAKPASAACKHHEIRGNDCQAECVEVDTTTCQDGDGCCPTGCTQANDNDCAPACNDGYWDKASEKCDIAISQGQPGACPSADACSAKPASTACKHHEIRGNDCQAECVEVDTTACQDGDGCCPTGCTQANDNDCAPACNDGYWDKASEKCDTGINQGEAGACPTAAACSAKPASTACKHHEIRGNDCQAECVEVDTTTCQDGDGCCPNGCTQANDNDCAPACNDGYWDKASEKCDIAISQGQPGACPSAAVCSAKPASTACKHHEIRGNDCQAECVEVDTTACQDGDGCCPSGCTHAKDKDCPKTPQPAVCGNGIWEQGEECDTSIAPGKPGACPDRARCESLESPNPCEKMAYVGSGCSAKCVPEPITQCVDFDQCCARGCTSQNDSDCIVDVRYCANGTREFNENCGGDGIVCPTDTTCSGKEYGYIRGSYSYVRKYITGAACEAKCNNVHIRECEDGDTYCPAGCAQQNDNDCPKLGDPKYINVEIGKPCNQDTDCSNPSEEYATCRKDPVSGKGYCTASAVGVSSGKLCPPNTREIGNGGYCVLECVSGECPEGFVCDPKAHVCYPKECDEHSCNKKHGVCIDTDGDGYKECRQPPGGLGTICDNDSDCTGAPYHSTRTCEQLPGATKKICIQRPKPGDPFYEKCYKEGIEETKAFDSLGRVVCLQYCQNDKDCPKGAGLSCINHACQTGKSSIGGICQKDSDCIGSGVSCLRRTATDHYGICALECTSNESICPSGMLCEPSLGGSKKYCSLECKYLNSFGKCPRNSTCTPSKAHSGKAYCTVKKKLDIKVGIPCNSDTDCGPDGHCYKETKNGQFRGEFCSSQPNECIKGGECPAGTECGQTYDFHHVGQYYETIQLCAVSCNPNASGQCREGYFCGAEQWSYTFQCLPNPAGSQGCLTNADCTPPRQCLDNKTTSVSYGYKECINPSGKPIDGECQTADDCNVPGAICEPYGPGRSRCTKECSTQACPRDTKCIPTYGKENEPRCEKECSTVGEKNPDNPSFTCTHDRHMNTNLYKYTPILNKEVGDTCTDDADCGPDGTCLNKPPISFPGSYCSAYCGDAATICPGDSYCAHIWRGTENHYICAKTCSTKGDCRPGYTCGTLPYVSIKVCLPQ